ncbi:autophagy protein atg9 [Geranomyces variabilis]|nr:autophagy protein atg9 [Geranomyces variabilis]
MNPQPPAPGFSDVDVNGPHGGISYAPPILNEDEPDSDGDPGPSFYDAERVPVLSVPYGAGIPSAQPAAPAELGAIYVTDWDQAAAQNPSAPLRTPVSRQNFDNFTPAYQPPTIPFENDEGEDDSDGGEAPASIRYEMRPLTGERTRTLSAQDLGSRSQRQRLGLGRPARSPKPPGLLGNFAASLSMAASSDLKERAMAFWVNAKNEDLVLEKIYSFYEGKGFYSIMLARVTNLLILAFIVAFSIFLFACIDYPLIHEKKRLSEVIADNCLARYLVHMGSKLIIVIFFGWWSWEFLMLAREVPHLLEVSRFYKHVLGFEEAEMQTITWADVVATLSTLPVRDAALNAHTIANRILRKENYLVALFNKDVLDLSVPLPYIADQQFLTNYIEWSLTKTLLEYVFDESGQVRAKFVTGRNRTSLVNGLKKRFQHAALWVLAFAPFILFYRLMHFFFRYTEEFHKNPSSLGTRQYSPLAYWKFREFNELPDLFQRRLNRSYRIANKYMNQFPNARVTTLARFISFITGAFLSVLIVATVLSEDLLHGFEITSGRSVFFYIGIFATSTAVLRGMVPDDNEVFEPALLLRNVVEEVRYFPDSWRGRMHSEAVRREFGALLPYKLFLFFQDLASVILAPIILYYSLPSCAAEIIDFFKEFTVHVDGVGHVCSFAVWDFRKHGNAKVRPGVFFPIRTANRECRPQPHIQFGAQTQAQDERFMSKGGKMEQSFLNFRINNPDWDPGEDESQYLNAILARVERAGGEAAQPAQFGNSSSLLIHSLLRPKVGRRGAILTESDVNIRSLFSQRTVRLETQLHPHPSSSPRPLHDTRSTLHPQQSHPGERAPHPLAFSTASVSQLDAAGEAGRLLFGLLDRIYEENRTMY